jgi:hypothetical protein
LVINCAILLLNLCILQGISNYYTLISKNRVTITVKLVLINLYPFTLILISIQVLIFSLLLLIVYKKVKKSPPFKQLT